MNDDLTPTSNGVRGGAHDGPPGPGTGSPPLGPAGVERAQRATPEGVGTGPPDSPSTPAPVPDGVPRQPRAAGFGSTITRLAIGRPLFMLMVIASVMIFGAIGYVRMGVDLFPAVNFPVVLVTVPYPGASPEVVESLVTKPVEDAVAGLADLDQISSFSSEGLSAVTVQFKDRRQRGHRGHRGGEAGQRRPGHPAGRRAGPDDPQVRLQPAADHDPGPVRRAHAGAALPPGRRAHPQPPGDPERGRPGDHLRWPAARGAGGGRSGPPAGLRADPAAGDPGPGGGERRPPRGPGAGAAARTSTCASTPSSAPPGTSRAPSSPPSPAGARCASGTWPRWWTASRTRPSSAGSTARTPSGSRSPSRPRPTSPTPPPPCGRRSPASSPSCPRGPSWRSSRTSSVFIRNSLTGVQRTLIEAVLLTGLVLLVFLHSWRSTVIVLLAIPTSLIATFGVMWLQGFTLNFLTTLALTLTIGILVDDSIVVLENIYRHLAKGEPPRLAADQRAGRDRPRRHRHHPGGRGGVHPGRPALRPGGAVLPPVRLHRGRRHPVLPAGLLHPDPLAGLALAEGGGRARAGPPGRPSGAGGSGASTASRGPTSGPLRWTLRGRWLVVLGAVVALAVGVALPATGIVKSEFFPAQDQGVFTLFLETPPGTNLATTQAAADPGGGAPAQDPGGGDGLHPHRAGRGHHPAAEPLRPAAGGADREGPAQPHGGPGGPARPASSPRTSPG